MRDLLRDLSHFAGAGGRIGDLSQYVRAQGEGMFDVLASDESATAGEMLTATAFAQIRQVVSRFYKLIVVVPFAPYERLIDSGEPIRYGALSTASTEAWMKIAAAVAEGL